MTNLPDERARPANSAPLRMESIRPLLAKEVERSRRYYRGFGLVRIQAGEGVEKGAATPAVPSEWLEAVPLVVRRADVVAHTRGRALYVLLPETPPSGMPVVMCRLEQALARTDSVRGGTRANVRLDQATYPRDGETAEELLDALTEGRT